MMDEQELERRLAELRTSWRVPSEPPLAELWPDIEARAFPQVGRRPWTRTLLPLAAMLLLGFGIGQIAPRLRSRPAPGISATSSPAEGLVVRPASDEAPFVGIAADYLERVTGLLVTLADANRHGQPLGSSATQARDLLATTRLLIDSPQANDPRLQSLLDDLELVLAQIARLPQRATQPEVNLIDQTLDQREVLPRLRVMLAETPSSQP
jgi:hypothetical protein